MNASFCNPLPPGNATAEAWIAWDALIYTYVVVNCINITMGPAVHCFVLRLICEARGGGGGSELFALNLTLCELLWCLCSLAFLAALWFGELFYVAFFTSAVVGLGRPLFHSLICLERFLAVLHPVSFLRFRPLRYRLACSTAVWAALPLFGVLLFLLGNTNNTHLFFQLFIPLNLLFLAFKLFCLLAILRALKFPKVDRMVNVKRNEKARLKLRKAMTQILIVTVSMLGQYVPVVVLGSLLLKLPDEYLQMFWFIGHAITSIVSYVQPVLHIWRVKRRLRLPGAP